MSRFTVEDAAEHLDQLIDQAMAGEEVVIASEGKPDVVLVAMSDTSAVAVQVSHQPD